MVLGEAARALSADFRTRHRDDVWLQASNLRNVIVHQYFEIDTEIIWGVVERELPALSARVQDLLDAYPS